MLMPRKLTSQPSGPTFIPPCKSSAENAGQNKTGRAGSCLNSNKAVSMCRKAFKKKIFREVHLNYTRDHKYKSGGIFSFSRLLIIFALDKVFQGGFQ